MHQLWQVLLQVSNFDTNQALTSVAALRLRQRLVRDPMLIEKEAADLGASPAWENHIYEPIVFMGFIDISVLVHNCLMRLPVTPSFLVALLAEELS